MSTSFALPNLQLAAHLLHTLARCRAPITIWTLIESADPCKDLYLTQPATYRELNLLQRYGIVAPTWFNGEEIAWSITDVGRTWLRENESALAAALGKEHHAEARPEAATPAAEAEPVSFPDRMTRSAGYWLLTAFGVGVLIGMLTDQLRTMR